MDVWLYNNVDVLDVAELCTLFLKFISFLGCITQLAGSYLFVLDRFLLGLRGGSPVILVSTFPVPVPLQIFFFSCINSDQLTSTRNPVLRMLLRKSLQLLGKV